MTVLDFYSSKERIYIQGREKTVRAILLQKLNVPAEPIAPDLHLCKMNIGNYYIRVHVEERAYARGISTNRLNRFYHTFS